MLNLIHILIIIHKPYKYLTKMNLAFIFARGGSKGLKNKNVKMFNGKLLIFYSINIAKKIKLIDDVYVSTDDSKSLNYQNHLVQK